MVIQWPPELSLTLGFGSQEEDSRLPPPSALSQGRWGEAQACGKGVKCSV